MTTTFTAQPRRQAAGAARPPRELPVLFHLMDVSRPRGYAAPATLAPPAEFTLGTRLPAEDAAAPSQETSVTSSLAAAFDLQMAASLAETGGLDAAPAEGISADSDDPRNASQNSDAESADSSASSETERTSAGDATAASPLETPPPGNGDDAVALRQRAEERQRKRNVTARDDWFSSHGRYIAIGFFIALVATIFLARAQRKPAGPPLADKHAHHDHGTHQANPVAKTIKSASAELPVDDHAEDPKSGASPAAAITGVKTSPGASTAQTALHPPTIPQLPAQSSAAGAADESLFPWSKSGEERVAARTDTTPTSPPQYPTTNYRGDYQPVGPIGESTQTAGPASNLPHAPSGSIYGPAVPAPAGAAYSPPANQPQPSYPTTNSASGYRYERTGSGLH